MNIPVGGTPGFWSEYRLVSTELGNKKAFTSEDSIWYQGPFESEELKKLKATIAHLEEKMKLLEEERQRFLLEQDKARLSLQKS